MEKKYTEIKEQCYIVSLDNGIRREEPITIEVFNSFKDGSHLVQLNDTVFGVYKSNSLNPETMYIDDFDIIKSDIAELLDIDHEESKRIVTEESNVGVFTLLNYSKNIETRISATTVLNHILEYINKGYIVGEEALWVNKVLQYPTGEKDKGISDPNQIEDIIKLGMYALVKEIELQKGIPLEEKAKDAIEKNYIRMILFDYIISRKCRGLDYYLISKINEQGKPIWTDAYLSPISVSNNIEKDALIGENDYLINNKIVDKNILLNVLFEKYYRKIKKMTESINDAKKLYSDAISRIIYNNTELTKASNLEDSIIKNIEKIAKMQNDIEDKLDKEQKTNKVERTMATQSLNVRVTTKLDLIQKKYPINPKDHPELSEKCKDKEEVKLVVEDEKHSSGFAATSIILAIISLICGIGAGIAYVLLTLGN